MEKNVIVVDEKGNSYGVTYQKRAKGLVKNGRARFIDENVICLACPPTVIETEDIEMSENTKNIIADEKTGEVIAIPQIQEDKKGMPTIEYVLEKIEEIRKNDQYIHSALSQLQEITCQGPGDICGQSKADAIAHVVDAREETNRKLLTFYEMLYRDILKTEDKSQRAEMLLELVRGEQESEARMDMFHDLCLHL